MKILIAEDEKGVRIVIRKLMDRWGYDCDIVDNGKDAVDLAVRNEGAYDVCLMDIGMPGMDGCEAAKLIRLKTKYLPIIALTGDSSFGEKLPGSGMDALVKKPFDLNELREKIIELSVKTERITHSDSGVIIEKEMPMDRKHAEELKELAKKDLRKVRFFEDPEAAVIVHKNTVNKISHDLGIKKQALTVFVNRDPEKPTRCVIYREIPHLMPQEFLTEEEYEESVKAEDRELKKYPEIVLKEGDGKDSKK